MSKSGHCTEAHRWEPAVLSAPLPWQCRFCPAVAANCAECRGMVAGCLRCGGTGSVEVCEVSQQELSRLRLADRRWDWLLRFWALAVGQRAVDVCDFVDGCVSRDESPVQAAQLAGIKIPGTKKRPGPHTRGKRPTDLTA